jgi:hypothetical protein
MACQTKVGNLKDALVVDEKIGSLHISVEDMVFVKIAQTLEQLEHVTFDLSLFKVDRWVIEKARKIMVHIWGHHVHDGFLAFVGCASLGKPGGTRMAGVDRRVKKTHSASWDALQPCLLISECWGEIAA